MQACSCIIAHWLPSKILAVTNYFWLGSGSRWENPRDKYSWNVSTASGCHVWGSIIVMRVLKSENGPMVYHKVPLSLFLPSLLSISSTKLFGQKEQGVTEMPGAPDCSFLEIPETPFSHKALLEVTPNVLSEQPRSPCWILDLHIWLDMEYLGGKDVSNSIYAQSQHISHLPCLPLLSPPPIFPILVCCLWECA